MSDFFGLDVDQFVSFTWDVASVVLAIVFWLVLLVGVIVVILALSTKQ